MRRPLSGALLGLILGLAIAVILQQLGVWPLDRLTVFLLPGAVGLLGMLLTSMGRQGSTGTMVVALIILLPVTVWGALGLLNFGENGQLNGGCTVNAASSIDATTVTDTSRADPFRIDPTRGLSWVATSPSVFDDYEWKIWTQIGGFEYPLASEENQNNDDGSQMNEGDVPNVADYARALGINLDEIRGAIIVGGDAAGVCDGFGFVSLEGDPFETLVSQIALAIAILAFIALLTVAFTGRGGLPEPSTAIVADAAPEAVPESPTATGAGTAAGLAAAEEEQDRLGDPDLGPGNADDDKPGGADD